MLTLTEKTKGKGKKATKPQRCHFISQNRNNVPYGKREGGKVVGVVRKRL